MLCARKHQLHLPDRMLAEDVVAQPVVPDAGMARGARERQGVVGRARTIWQEEGEVGSRTCRGKMCAEGATQGDSRPSEFPTSITAAAAAYTSRLLVVAPCLRYVEGGLRAPPRARTAARISSIFLVGWPLTWSCGVAPIVSEWGAETQSSGPRCWKYFDMLQYNERIAAVALYCLSVDDDVDDGSPRCCLSAPPRSSLAAG